MLADRLLIFTGSGNQTLNSTQTSTDILDLGPLTNNTVRDIGSGENIWLRGVVTTAATASTAATLTPTLITHSASGFSANTVVFSAGALTSAQLATAGAEFWYRLDPAAFARYLRVNMTVATGPFTAGAMRWELVLNRHDTRKYEDNVVRA